jgi:hypothetical protein
VHPIVDQNGQLLVSSLTKYEHAVIHIAAGLAANPEIVSPEIMRNDGTKFIGCFTDIAEGIATAIFDRLAKESQ